MIVITREEEEASRFISLVESIGFNVIALKLINLIPNAMEIDRLRHMLEGHYDYILFMSANAVDMLNESILSMLRGKNIVAVGPKTKARLEEHKVYVNLMPSRYSSYGIMDLFKGMDVKGKKILIPRSAAASDHLKEWLTSLGMHVDEVRFYDVKPNKDARLEEFISLLKNGLIKCIVFTSASNVDAFFNLIRYDDTIDMLKKIYIIAIGPFTNDRLKAYGIDAIVADEHTIEGIFRTIKKII